MMNCCDLTSYDNTNCVSPWWWLWWGDIQFMLVRPKKFTTLSIRLGERPKSLPEWVPRDCEKSDTSSTSMNCWYKALKLFIHSTRMP